MALHPMLVKYLDGLEALTDGRGFDREHEQARLFVEAACNAYDPEAEEQKRRTGAALEYAEEQRRADLARDVNQQEG